MTTDDNNDDLVNSIQHIRRRIKSDLAELRTKIKKLQRVCKHQNSSLEMTMKKSPGFKICSTCDKVLIKKRTID